MCVRLFWQQHQLCWCAQKSEPHVCYLRTSLLHAEFTSLCICDLYLKLIYGLRFYQWHNWVMGGSLFGNSNDAHGMSWTTSLSLSLNNMAWDLFTTFSAHTHGLHTFIELLSGITTHALAVLLVLWITNLTEWYITGLINDKLWHAFPHSWMMHVWQYWPPSASLVLAIDRVGKTSCFCHILTKENWQWPWPGGSLSWSAIIFKWITK